MTPRVKAREDLHAWGRQLSERTAEKLRKEHPELDEEAIKALVNWVWYNVRGSMDE